MSKKDLAALSQQAERMQYAPQLSFVKDERNQCLSFTFSRAPAVREPQGVLLEGHMRKHVVSTN